MNSQHFQSITLIHKLTTKLNVIRAECRLDYREPGLIRKTKTPFDVIAISQQSLPFTLSFGYQYGQYGVIGTGGGI